MRIEQFRTLEGPNVYTYKPVLLTRLNLQELTDKESLEISGFNERLVAMLPGLADHHCAAGKPGGFIERLRGGTYFGHIVEHIALELSALAGIPAFFGKTRFAGAPGIYNVVTEFKSDEGMRFLVRTAVDLVTALVNSAEFDLEDRLAEARSIIADSELGPSTSSIVEAVEKRGIPWRRVGTDSFVQLGYGSKRRFIQAAMAENTSAIAMEAAGDKEFTKLLLRQVSIPVPRGEVVRTEEDAVEALDHIGVPCVVKPLDGRQGKGVSLNISTPDQMKQAFAVACEFSDKVLVEELFVGNNYRVLVVDGRMIAASERNPACVIGDGHHSISELIDIENLNPTRGESHEKPLTRIKVDDIMTAYLEKAGLRLSDVPGNNEMVCLRESINLSTGGTAKDVTDEVHPEVRDMCERAARVVGLNICGIDLVMRDIRTPVELSGVGKQGGGIIELNAAPGLRMHLFPSEGKPRDVGAAIVEMLYPEGQDGRIPITSITGTNGKTTVTRMIGHVIGQTGRVVGMTTTDGIYVAGKRILNGDTTGPQSAKTILSDPAVEVAVLETARGGIVRRGLGYDWSDVGVITNIGPDHIGQDGIESVEDILHIKGLVAERVREGGSLVLNADDPHLVELAGWRRVKTPSRKIIYFSLDENNLVLTNHVRSGGTAYFVQHGWIVESIGDARNRIVNIIDIPATMYGTAEFQVANCLAAVAALRVNGLAIEQIADGLKSFQSDADNPGRANFYSINGGYVMLDYGHNPDAFAAVCRMAARWEGRRLTGIIGVPGDRDDSVVREAGRVAARGFHRIIIREDQDLRGRRQGEIARLLCQAVNEESPGTECRIAIDAIEALRSEIQTLRQGDVVIVFYDDLAPVLSLLNESGARRVSAVSKPVLQPTARPADLVSSMSA
jgi:cyanophycin synthetase